MKREMRDDQHGTTTGYSRGCRCVPCRAANSAYRKAIRTLGLPEESPSHGTLSGYRHHGCRCEPCIDANAQYMGKRRVATLPDASGPTMGELREWGRALGLPVGRTSIPNWLAERWNREHPDRPYEGAVAKKGAIGSIPLDRRGGPTRFGGAS